MQGHDTKYDKLDFQMKSIISYPRFKTNCMVPAQCCIPSPKNPG